MESACIVEVLTQLEKAWRYPYYVWAGATPEPGFDKGLWNPRI